MGKYEEYLICKKRGHKTNPMSRISSYAIYNSPSFEECEYCGTTYWTTTVTTEHEKNAPKPTKDSKLIDGGE